MSEDRKMGIGVGVIIRQNDQILLALRNSDKDLADSSMRLEGTYTFPSGKVLYGESFEEAGIRKVKEETGLDVEEIKVISVQSDINEYAHYATVGLEATKYSGTIRLSGTKEIVSLKWFDIDKMPENLCFPSRKILDCYLNNKFYNNQKR